jgi:hypothetical protein
MPAPNKNKIDEIPTRHSLDNTLPKTLLPQLSSTSRSNFRRHFSKITYFLAKLFLSLLRLFALLGDCSRECQAFCLITRQRYVSGSLRS